jgi:hypothetical protein
MLKPEQTYKYLGYNIPVNFEPTTYIENIVKHVPRVLQQFTNKSLPPSIKAEIINMYGTAIVRYHLTAIPPSPETDAILEQADKNIRRLFIENTEVLDS